VSIDPVSVADTAALRDFLAEADLTLAGLDAPTVHLWVERDDAGSVIGSTGFELSADGKHALIRSVAVAPSRRALGAGSRLAMFWQKLGFESADRDELAAALPGTHQVRLFKQTGQLGKEVAWSRLLDNQSR
jgi:hypothetical protein